MKPMYPSKVDCYRIIQILFRAKRKGRTQEEIEKEAKIPQTLISNVQQLEQSLKFPKRRVTREKFLSVLTTGLKLPRDTVDAFAWLFDGEPLTEKEVGDFFKSYQPEPTAKWYKDDKGLRRLVLRQLRAVHNSYYSSTGSLETKVKIFSGEEQGELDAQKEMRQTERLAGQRLLVTKFPSFLTLSAEAHLIDESLRQVRSPKGRQELRNINNETVPILTENIKLYGERSIHHKESLENYLNKDLRHYLSLEHRRKQIERLIELLDYEHYEIGLEERIPNLEVETKILQSVMIRATPHYERGAKVSGWGPRYVEFLDEASVLSFFLDFEEHWDMIKSENRDKKTIIPFLETILSKNKNPTKRATTRKT